MILPGKSIFSPPSPPAAIIAAPPPPPPTREDPSVAEAANKARQSELRAKGRRAFNLAPKEETLGEPAAVNRPEARASQLLGQ